MENELSVLTTLPMLLTEPLAVKLTRTNTPVDLIALTDIP
jgi:hypothetical protein